MEYIAAGNVMVDTVYFEDGRKNRDGLGGPSVFAFSGIKLWCDDVMLVCNAGRDFYSYFTKWLDCNEIVRDGIKIKTDYCNHSHLVYYADGTYGSKIEDEDHWSFVENLGYMKTSPEEIGEHTAGGGTKGVYLAQNHDRVFWENLGAIKHRDGFKLMWEIEGPSARKKHMDDVLHALQYTDIFSINIQECRQLSGCDTEEENISFLKKIPVDMVLFRVGKKGLYTLQGGKHYFHPSAPVDREVDPTGCGNCSTGSALYGYCMYPHDPVMVGIIANVAAAQNIRQFGVIPNFLAVRAESEALVHRLYKAYR